MVVVGIDPGTATTGYGFVHQTDQGELEAIDYGVILTPAGLPLEQRLLAALPGSETFAASPPSR